VSSSILTTKLFIPTYHPGLVSRQHLIQKLDAGQERRLILVSAPAGYGKTTLLAEWVNQQAVSACWVSLDEQDNNPGCFFSYLVASLRSLSIDIKAQNLSEGMEWLRENFSGFLSRVVNQISTKGGPVYLVLDDYHRITNPEIHQALSYLLENLPRNMHLTIASRSDPLLRLAKYETGEFNQPVDSIMDQAKALIGVDRAIFLEFLASIWESSLENLIQLMPLALDDVTATDAVFSRIFRVSNQPPEEYSKIKEIMQVDMPDF
jgi:hypothetical protein